MRPYSILIITLAVALALTGCGEKVLTPPEVLQQPTTDPSDYLYSGTVGTEYVYTQTYVFSDDNGRDSAYTRTYSNTIVSRTADSISGVKRVQTRSNVLIPQSERTFSADVNRMWGSDTTFTELASPLSIGSVYYRVFFGRSTIQSMDDTLRTPAGSFRCIKIVSDSTTFSMTDSTGTVLYADIKAIATVWYSPGTHAVMQKEEGRITRSTYPTPWKRVSITTTLVKINRK
ncbi:MAG: hypothetical protein JNL32_02710 [Candidatus Kapabacteria bacterium]|nr:hypothetical protein [Candidatus Kapabacteria bacterium]